MIYVNPPRLCYISLVFSLVGIMIEQWSAFSWFIFVVLVLFSVMSWYVIITRTIALVLFDRDFKRIQSKWRQLAGFEGISDYARGDKSPLVNLLVGGAFEWAKINMLDKTDQQKEDLLSDILRHETHLLQRRLESGQTLLALCAALAPFIGLLGTVVGIYHTLDGFQHLPADPTLSMISGSIGETLIMTAFGLLVAIPAAFAYNLFARCSSSNRYRLNCLARVYHTLLVYKLKLDGL